MRSTFEEQSKGAMQISHTEVRRHPIWQRVLHEHPVVKPRMPADTLGFFPIATAAIGVIVAAIAWLAWQSRN